jgi:ribosomal protein S2
MTHEFNINVWITKYALTTGIIEVKARKVDPSMVTYRRKGGMFNEFSHDKDWHTSKLEALNRFDQMKEKKIKSLQKQIETLKTKLPKIIID